MAQVCDNYHERGDRRKIHRARCRHGNSTWTTRFAKAEKDSGLVEAVAEHFYAGAAGRGVTAQQGIDTMLSADWLKRNEKLYEKVAAPVMADGLPFGFTEANDHYTGGVPGASDTFAGALWALDFLHWWAAHGTRFVDFHNTTWVVSDIITPDTNGEFKINPKGYGLKAFDLGGHGNSAAVTISNADGVNLTAYAVRDASNIFVTIINKEHGAGAHAADVAIVPGGKLKAAEAMFLAVSDGDAAAKTGVTLGGAVIKNDAPWSGKWTPLDIDKPEQCVVKVKATSAAIVRMTVQ